jgi:pimeloyl-ACP methyl ester carboxylesterase
MVANNSPGRDASGCEDDTVGGWIEVDADVQAEVDCCCNGHRNDLRRRCRRGVSGVVGGRRPRIRPMLRTPGLSRLGTRRIGPPRNRPDVHLRRGGIGRDCLPSPVDRRPVPAAVWVHGAGPAERLRWGGQLLPGLVDAGVAVLTYDKRGTGGSDGECCPGDEGHFNLLTADAEGAVAVLRGLPDVDADQVGLVGASQAGWIAPRAAVETDAAFVALARAPTVPERTANLYERLAAGEEGELSRDEIATRVEDAGSDGFDPMPDLQHMTMPGLWLFGTADDVVPVDSSVDVLDQLEADGHDVTIDVFPNAGHGLLDDPPAAPEAPPTLIAW